MMTRWPLAAMAVVFLTCAPRLGAQVHRLAEMNTEQIRALDRQRTVVLMPGGILEQHGPYLPSFTDGYGNEWLTERLARAIAARPGWSVVIFPTIPLGVGGANEIGRRYDFPGTYAVRSTTLRSVLMDLGGELGDQGFRWIFVIHLHGAPNHNRAIQQAGDFFRDTYGGHMVHLLSLMPVFTAGAEWMTPEQKAEDGFTVHAGAEETSGLLAIRPDLVDSAYRSARPQTGRDWDDLVRMARATGWPGYFGSPRLARAEAATPGLEAFARSAGEWALKILDGLDERTLPSFVDVVGSTPQNRAIDRDALAREARLRRVQEAWLQAHHLQP
jgi:creatinine amidohydrolase/Fe(II)-dependent formamide hydrolase-like protein